MRGLKRAFDIFIKVFFTMKGELRNFSENEESHKEAVFVPRQTQLFL